MPPIQGKWAQHNGSLVPGLATKAVQGNEANTMAYRYKGKEVY